MKTFLAHLRAFLVLTLAFPAAAAHGATLPVTAPDAPSSVLSANANCNAVGQRYAESVGGQFAGARAENRDGRTVCVVVVLLPASGDRPPLRDEVELPAG